MFLDKLLGKDKDKPNVGVRNVIQHDDWDSDYWNRTLGEMKALSNADDKLADFVETGHEAMTDAYFSLYKAVPALEDQKNVRPSFLVNHTVIDEAMKLKEYDMLRTHSKLDLVASGMACITMEPELEVIFDKLRDEQEMANKLEKMAGQMGDLEGEGQSVDEMIEAALAEGDKEAAQNYQEQAARIEEQMEQLRNQMQESKQALEEALNGKRPEISSSMADTLRKAQSQADNVDSLSSAWGLDPGTIKKMSADKRIALAKRIDNEKFRKIAQIIGPMRRLAMSEQSKKLDFAKDEIFDLELGSNIEQVLPEELLFLTDEEIDMLFYEKFYNDNLMQFKLRGTEKVAKGGIIFIEDGSSSMSGSRETWAKAVGLALLQIARSQKREFFSIHFGGPGVWKETNFNGPNRAIFTEDYAGNKQEFTEELDGILDFAETFFSSGTDFVTPLSRAMDRIGKDFDNEGKIKADIVFCTDGQAGVPQTFLDMLAAEKERTGCRIFGIVIGNEPESEPMWTICDGRVFEIKDLINGKDISDIFRDV